MEFDGRLLHQPLRANCLEFAELMSLQRVRYSHDAQCRSTLTTFVEGIFRQGMNLGIEAVVKVYKGPEV